MISAARPLLPLALLLSSAALAGSSEKPALSVNAAPIGRTVAVEQVAKVPRADGPVMYLPAHTRAVLNLPGQHWKPADVIEQPAAYVSVYPIAGLNAQYPGQQKDTVDAVVRQQLETLKTIATTGRIPAGKLPYFPLPNAFQAVRGAAKYIQTADVRGVRYLTIYSQESSVLFPRTAVEYTFQGITRDGKNLVVMHVPYTLGSLPTAEQIRQDKNGGFVAPFPKTQTGPDAQLFQKKSAGYLKWVAAQMDAESARLGALDSVVKSIRVR